MFRNFSCFGMFFWLIECNWNSRGKYVFDVENEGILRITVLGEYYEDVGFFFFGLCIMRSIRSKTHSYIFLWFVAESRGDGGFSYFKMIGHAYHLVL